MKRRRTQAQSDSPNLQTIKTTTSPERRRSKRGTSQTPAKPSKRQPSEQLHMTTRTASKAAETANSSAATSVNGGTSRRSSLNDVYQNGTSGADNERPAKRSRVSAETSTRPQISLESPLDPRRHDDAILDSPPSSQEEGRSTKRRRVSTHVNIEAQISSAILNGVADGSHAKSIENEQLAESPSDKRMRRAKVDAAEPPPDLTDASSAPDSPEPNVETALPREMAAEVSVAPSQEPAKVVKRLPGRRRAPHQNVNIEVDLRRQLQLKTAYRSVVKALKPVLAELAERTINEVDVDPSAHERSEEHETVMEQLNGRLREKLASLEEVNRMKTAYIKRRHAADVELKNRECEFRIQKLKDDFFTRCKYGIMEVLRVSATKEDGDASEDEDGVIAPRQGVRYPFEDTGPLGPAYDSRSRMFIETERLWDKLHQRYELDRARKSFLAENIKELFDDSTSRKFAVFKGLLPEDEEVSYAVFNVKQLAKASDEVERGVLPKDVPVSVLQNSEATALQLLASASEKAVPVLPVQKKLSATDSAPSIATPLRRRSTRPPSSPYGPPSGASAAMSLEATYHSPVKPPAVTNDHVQQQVSTSMPQTTKANGPTARGYSSKINDLLNKSQDEPPRANQPTRVLTYEEPEPKAPLATEPVSRESAVNGTMDGGHAQEAGSSSNFMQQPTPGVSTPVPKELAQPPPAEKPPAQGYWSKFTPVGSRSERSPGKGPLSRISSLLSPRDSTPDKSASEKSADAISVKRESNENPHMGPPPSRVSLPPADQRDASRSSAGLPSISPHPQPVQPRYEPSASSGSMQHDRRRSWDDPGRRASGPTPAQQLVHQHPGYAPSPTPAAQAPAIPPPRTGPPSMSPFLPAPQQGYGFQPSYQTPYSPAQPPPPYRPSGPYGQPTHPSPYIAPAPGPAPAPTFRVSGPSSYPMYPPQPGYQQPPPPQAYPAPLRFATSQYGQPILPANLDPRNTQHQSPYPPQVNSPAYGQPQRPPEQPKPATPQSNPNEPIPRRRHRNYNTTPGSEFRPYTGPKRR